MLDAAASGLDDVAFSKDLIEKAGVAGMPMGGFYHGEEQSEAERFETQRREACAS